jgi:hypothetical protein
MELRTNQLPFMGQFHATLEYLTGATTTQVHVIKGNFGCLLSYQTASAVGLIMLNVNNVKSGHATHEQPMKEYVKGIGTLKNFEVKLRIDDTVPPVAQPPPPVVFLSTCGKRSQMRSTR